SFVMTFDDMFTHTFNLFISLPRRKHRGNLSIIKKVCTIHLLLFVLEIRFTSFPNVLLYGIPKSGTFIGNPFRKFKLEYWIPACLPVGKLSRE
ncbi:MAG: hypothetical protein ACYC5R_06355, partial [Melioribacteraceae bacterium]